MFFYLIYYLTLVSLIFFIGRGFFISSQSVFGLRDEKFSKDKIVYCLYPILGLFCLGFISLSINFFLPSKIWLILIAVFPLILSNYFKKIYTVEVNFFIFFLLFSIISFSYFFMLSPGYDAGLYHLNHQQWIHDHKILFGLSNVHYRYGFSSLQEYIAGPLWNLNYLGGIKFPNLFFFSSYLLFIFTLFFSTYLYRTMIGAVLIIFLMFKAFGNPSFLIDDYSYVDASTAIVIIFSVSIMFLSMLEKYYSKLLFFIISSLLIFAIAMKANAILCIIFYIFYLFYWFIKQKKDFDRELLYPGIFLFLLVTVLFLKNIIVSGCLIFPISFTCFDFSWSNQQVLEIQNSITQWGRAPRSEISAIGNWNWIGSWFFRNLHYILGYLLTNIFLLVLFKFLLSANKKVLIRSNIFPVMSLFVFSLSTLIIWFIKSPEIRLGYGYYPLFLLSLCMFYFLYIPNAVINIKYFFVRKVDYKSIFLSICIVSLLANSQIYNFFKVKESVDLYQLESNPIEYRHDDAYGTRPTKGDICNLNKDCYPYENVNIIKFLYSYDVVVKRKIFSNEILRNGIYTPIKE